jgi:fructokinase
MHWFAGVEGGGTKCNCIVASQSLDILSSIQIPTTNPNDTLIRICEFLKSVEKKHKIHLESIGLAFFGPINLNPTSSDFGSLNSTPKMAWRNFPLLQFFRNQFSIPIAIDTDVNGAALAEHKWGIGIGYSNLIYITVGTGIGGGIIAQDSLLHGNNHPELGHIFIKHDLSEDPFTGCCHYHGDCLEGLASGTALRTRWGVQADNLPQDHTAWDLEAYYLGQAVCNLYLTTNTQMVILGGGVMNHPGLLEKVQSEFIRLMDDYLPLPNGSLVTDFIVAPKLQSMSGSFGAIALANSIQLQSMDK